MVAKEVPSEEPILEPLDHHDVSLYDHLIYPFIFLLPPPPINGKP